MKIKTLLISLVCLTASSAMAQEIRLPYHKLGNEFFRKPDPLAQKWEAIPSETIPLFPQNITPPSIFETTVPKVEVKGLHNGKWIAIRLSWKDATQNTRLSMDDFSDACAIQFPLNGSADKTSPFMGNKGAPVAILHWKAIWQKDIEDHYQEIKDLYPNTWTDTDRFGKEIAIEVKNPVSQPNRKVPLEELMAEGFGTLTTQQKLDGFALGIWKEGTWTVLFTRPFDTKDKNDPVFKAGRKTALSFAIWEGGKKDVGGRKNYTMWIPLLLEKK